MARDYRRFWYPGLFLATLLLGGCEADATGFLYPCGGDFCNDHEECVSAEGGQVCQCLPGYHGLDCHDCPEGYRLNRSRECEEIYVYCDRECGEHGDCIASETGGTCECDTGYEGTRCDECAADYQDHDENGTCHPTCATASIDCAFPEVCRDDSGEARCECAVGYTGEDCTLCALGYQYTASGCVLTCEASGLECGERERCDESGTTPRCICLPQYSGASCDQCATGYVEEEATGLCLPTCDALDCGAHGDCRDDSLLAYCSCDDGYVGPTCSECQVGFVSDVDGSCSRRVTSDFTLISQARDGTNVALVAIDSASGDVVPVSQRNLGGLALGDGVLFATGGVSLSRVDLLSNELSLLTVTQRVAPALAFDSTREVLYAIGEPPTAPLLAVDPANGSVAVVGDTGLRRVFDLTYDEAGDQILVWGETLWGVDPTSGATRELGDLQLGTQGLSFDENGSLFATVATDLSPNEARLESCRLTAATLGESGYVGVEGVLVEAEGTQPVALDSATSGSAEIVAYLSAVGETERLVSIASDNPNAFLCLDLREATNLVIPAAARFRGLVAFTAGSGVNVTVETGFESVRSPAIHLGSLGDTITAPDVPVVHLYEPSEWSAARLPIDPAHFAPGPGQLQQLSAEGVVQGVTPLGDWVPLGTLSAVRFDDP